MFYDRFLALCDKRGIKPTPLIIGMGLSSSNVSQWKKGSLPRPHVLKKLADYFGVTLEELMDIDKKERPTPVTEGEPMDELGAQLMGLVGQLSPEAKKMLIAQLKVLLSAQQQQGDFPR